MTAKQYVIRATQIKGLDLIKPTKGNPGILAIDYTRKVGGVHPCVIDARTWAEAQTQLNNYYMVG
jgi:hypothetical protein